MQFSRSTVPGLGEEKEGQCRLGELYHGALGIQYVLHSRVDSNTEL